MNNNQRVMGMLLSAAIRNKIFTGSAAGTDWNEIYSLASEHQVLALLYPIVKDISEENGGPCSEILSPWKKAHAVSAIVHASYKREVKKVLTALRVENISVIVLKGLLLSQFYPRPELRTMGDVDLLVPKNEIERSIKTLRIIGYHDEKSSDGFVTLRKEDHIIDLHTQLVSKYQKALQWERCIWNRTDMVEIYGIPVLTLQDKDHFIFLCLHMVEHCIAAGFGLRQLCDIVLFSEAKEKEIDWMYVLSTVNDLGIHSFMRVIFAICNQLFNYRNKEFLSDYEIDEEKTNLLINDIFSGGVYGNNSMARFISGKYLAFLRPTIISRSEPGRVKRLRYLLFPPYRIIKLKYTYIQGRPYLTPVAWIHRIVANLFGKARFFRLRDCRALVSSHNIYEERYKLLKWLGLI